MYDKFIERMTGKVVKREVKIDPYNWCKHSWQIINPNKRLEQCIKCKKIRSFPRYPYSFGEEIEVEKKINNDGFWKSYPISELTPEQWKHFKEVMRKEVKSNGNK